MADLATSLAEIMGKDECPTRACDNCGDRFHLTPRELIVGRRRYCTTRCQYAHQQKQKSVRSVRHDRICQGCGKSFKILDSFIRANGKGTGTYCGKTCMTRYRKAGLHIGYRGGTSTQSRGDNWPIQRRAALARDSRTCQHCFKTTGRMEVHHVVPFRYFKTYEEANVLTNLLTLCAPCHVQADVKIRQEENVTGWKFN